jgi:hypothetical protein
MCDAGSGVGSISSRNGSKSIGRRDIADKEREKARRQWRYRTRQRDENKLPLSKIRQVGYIVVVLASLAVEAGEK